MHNGLPFLCCAVCLLAMPHSDRQYGCNVRRKKGEEDRDGEDNERTKQKDQYTNVHSGATCLVLGDFTFFCIIVGLV